jgi:hypothetical protein
MRGPSLCPDRTATLRYLPAGSRRRDLESSTPTFAHPAASVVVLGARRLFFLWRKNTWIGRRTDHRDRRLGLEMLVTAEQSW